MNLIESSMKRLSYLAVLASWVFFVVMAYFAWTTLIGGVTIFWIGSVVFYCIGGSLLFARQTRKPGILVLLPGLVCGLDVWGSRNSSLDEIGAHEVLLTFNVVDAETQKPIPNALVRVLYHGEPPELAQGQSEGRTNSEGNVTLRPDIIFTSFSTQFYHRGNVRFWDKRLEVTAVDYKPVCQELSDYTGSNRPLNDPSPPPVTIKMNRK